MTDRFELIARKRAVRNKIERTRRALEREQHPSQGDPNPKRVNQLENELERLMAQEFNLRLAIDRSQ